MDGDDVCVCRGDRPLITAGSATDGRTGLGEIAIFPSDNGGRGNFCGTGVVHGSLSAGLDGKFSESRGALGLETTYPLRAGRICSGLQLPGMECDTANDGLCRSENAQNTFARLGYGRSGGLQFLSGCGLFIGGIVQPPAVPQGEMANGLCFGGGFGVLHPAVCERTQYRQ